MFDHCLIDEEVMKGYFKEAEINKGVVHGGDLTAPNSIYALNLNHI